MSASIPVIKHPDSGKDNVDNASLGATPTQNTSIASTKAFLARMTPAKFHDLPTEIIRKIASELTKDSSVDDIALGLTCQRCYSIVKSSNPTPIPSRLGIGLHVPDNNGFIWRWRLQQFISEFLGNAYRYRIDDPRWNMYESSEIPFLLRTKFGNAFGAEEQDLNEKWHDWKEIVAYAEDAKALVSPHGLGDAWYDLLFPCLHRYVQGFFRKKKLGEEPEFDEHPAFKFALYGRYQQHFVDPGMWVDGFADWLELVAA